MENLNSHIGWNERITKVFTYFDLDGLKDKSVISALTDYSSKIVFEKDNLFGKTLRRVIKIKNN